MSKGFGIILSLDGNKNMMDSRIQKLLLKLGLKESTLNFINATPLLPSMKDQGKSI